MAEKELSSRIIHKHDSAANWAKATNFIPKQGELIVYDKDTEYTYERFKIGDGVTGVNQLPFSNVQADFNQNDKSALDYIQNRTHFDKFSNRTLLLDVNALLSEQNNNWETFDSDGIAFVRAYFYTNAVINVGDGYSIAWDNHEKTSVSIHSSDVYAMMGLSQGPIFGDIGAYVTMDVDNMDCLLVAYENHTDGGYDCEIIIRVSATPQDCKIYHYDVITHKLPNRFLSENIVTLQAFDQRLEDANFASSDDLSELETKVDAQIHIGPTEPTDPNVKIWINTSEEGTGVVPLLPRIATVTLPASGWTGSKNPYSQVVAVNGVTVNSKLDLQPTAQQIVSLQNEDIALMAENNAGTVTFYALGGKPTSNYTMQVLLTEVAFV
jgi:hypothetical protein